MSLERLDKIIASVCEISRKDARSIIRKKGVEINDNVIVDISQRIDIENSEIKVLGVKKTYKKFVYIMLNKPAGILSASNDKTRETVVDIVKNGFNREGLFPVGRLDKDTTGLLIVTDDGEFGHRVISPKSNIEKEYIVTVDKPVTPQDIKKLEEGVVLADGARCRPAKVKMLSDDSKKLSMVITEGKYHEIKRMLGVVGAGVNSLMRIRIGSLKLDETLLPGEYRELTDKELANL